MTARFGLYSTELIPVMYEMPGQDQIKYVEFYAVTCSDSLHRLLSALRGDKRTEYHLKPDERAGENGFMGEGQRDEKRGIGRERDWWSSEMGRERRRRNWHETEGELDERERVR
jgi:hypothetical protein